MTPPRSEWITFTASAWSTRDPCLQKYLTSAASGILLRLVVNSTNSPLGWFAENDPRLADATVRHNYG